MAKKIAVAFNKGGVTKTTTVVNLAGALSNEYPNSKILIIETDGQGNATRSFGKNARDYDKSAYDIFMNNFKAQDTVINAYNNIDIIPANDDINYLEFDTMKQISEGNQTDIAKNYFNMLDGKLSDLDKKYDVIFFDTPPELKAITSSVLAVADSVIIPFEPDTYSVDGLVSIMNRISTIKKEYNPKLRISGILAAKVQANTKIHADVRNSVMKYCMKNNIRYFQNEIPKSIRFASSTSYKGLPATLTMKNNEFVSSYFGLLHELYEDKTIDNKAFK